MSIENFTLSASNEAALIDKIKRLDKSATLYTVNIRPKKSKRSIEQNSRLWKLYTEFGKHLGLESDEVHQLMGYKFLRYQKEVNGVAEEFIKSTTKLNTKEMTDYQDSIERFGVELGFVMDWAF